MNKNGEQFVRPCTDEQLFLCMQERASRDRERAKHQIYAGATEAFLVSDRSLEDPDCAFMNWLRNEGFHIAHHHGNYGCWWVYINITRKQYAYGMPGISLVQPIGDHAITISEFKSIYQIYKKYEGKETFVFNA